MAAFVRGKVLIIELPQISCTHVTFNIFPDRNKNLYCVVLSIYTRASAYKRRGLLKIQDSDILRDITKNDLAGRRAEVQGG
jgi:hypothetical protein